MFQNEMRVCSCVCTCEHVSYYRHPPSCYIEKQPSHSSDLHARFIWVLIYKWRTTEPNDLYEVQFTTLPKPILEVKDHKDSSYKI